MVLPGRIDRKIEFPLPDEKTKRRIFNIHTSRMTVADDVTLDDLILAKDDLSGADIKVIWLARVSTTAVGQMHFFCRIISSSAQSDCNVVHLKRTVQGSQYLHEVGPPVKHCACPKMTDLYWFQLNVVCFLALSVALQMFENHLGETGL